MRILVTSASAYDCPAAAVRDYGAGIRAHSNQAFPGEGAYAPDEGFMGVGIARLHALSQKTTVGCPTVVFLAWLGFRWCR